MGSVGYRVIAIPLALLLCLISPLVTLLVVVPSLIYRALVQAIAWLFRPDLSNVFTGLGILTALESVHTRPKLSLLVTFILDGSLPLEVARDEFRQRVINDVDKAGNLRYSQLRQYWTEFMGYLFWKWDTSFSMENHVKLFNKDSGLTVPSPCTEDDLKWITDELLPRPFTPGRSPWEFHIIHNYQSKDNKDGREQTAVVLRIHHAMADGYSVLTMMLKVIGKEDAKVPRPNFPKLSVGQQLMRIVLLPLKLPLDVAELLLNFYDGPNVWHLVDTKLEKKYHTFCGEVKVDDIKRIKNKFGVGYNPAVYAVAAGAIRRLMQEAGQDVPKSVSSLVPLPYPGHPGGLAVYMSAFYLKFSLSTPSPTERLMEISSKMQRLGTATTVPLACWAGKFIAIVPTWGVRLMYNRLMCTLIMSSFPGPELELDAPVGTRLVDIHLAAGHPTGKLGAVAMLVSFAGRQRIGLTVDRKILAGSKTLPQNFSQHVNDEVFSLLNSPDCTDRVIVKKI